MAYQKMYPFPLCLWCSRQSVDGYFILVRFCEDHRLDAEAVRDEIVAARWRKGPQPSRESIRTWEDILTAYSRVTS